MSAFVVRYLLCAGVLTGVGVFGGTVPGIASADPTDTGTTSGDSTTDDPTGADDPAGADDPTGAEDPTAPTAPKPFVPTFHLPFPQNLPVFNPSLLFPHPGSIFGNGPEPTLPRKQSGSTETPKPETPKPDTVGEVEATEPAPDSTAPPTTRKPPPPPLTSPPEVKAAIDGPTEMLRQVNEVSTALAASAYRAAQGGYGAWTSLMNQVITPFLPQPPPPPKPSPTLRTAEAEPVAEAGGAGGGGGGAAYPLAANAVSPPVLQAPFVMPPGIRVAAPTAPTGANALGVADAQAVGRASAGASQAPAIRGPVPQPGPAIRGPVPQPADAVPASTSGRYTQRLGYREALRTARISDLAVVALPGLAGLLAITAGGGVIGFRQANSARYLHATGDARFLR